MMGLVCIYVIRGDGEISLNRRNSDCIPPTSGLWRCDIPDSEIQSLYVYISNDESNGKNMNSTKVQNPRRNSYAGTGCRHYTMHCLTLNSYQCILRMRVRVPRCPSRPLPVSRLFHAGCTSS